MKRSALAVVLVVFAPVVSLLHVGCGSDETTTGPNAACKGNFSGTKPTTCGAKTCGAGTTHCEVYTGGASATERRDECGKVPACDACPTCECLEANGVCGSCVAANGIATVSCAAP